MEAHSNESEEGMEAHSNESEALRLLKLAHNLLHHKDYYGCRKYALLAQQSDPRLAGAAHILAVSDVLAASSSSVNNQHNWYSILQVQTLSQDLKLIRNQYVKLLQLVKPTRNRFRFAEDAYKLVSEAWSVLSNPSRKSLFDIELSIFAESSKEESQQYPGKELNGTFWTACPYCYHLYEYPSVYKDCCLRCQNCRRPFHGASVSPPPMPILPGADQYFCCFGFFPLGFAGDADRRGNNEEIGSDEEVTLVEVSSESGCSFGNLWRQKKEKSSDKNVEIRKSEAEKVKKDLRLQRKNMKTVAKNTKKLRGKGRRAEGPDFSVELRKGEDDSDHATSEGIPMEGVVEFFDGIDDIFIGVTEENTGMAGAN